MLDPNSALRSSLANFGVFGFPNSFSRITVSHKNSLYFDSTPVCILTSILFVHNHKMYSQQMCTKCFIICYRDDVDPDERTAYRRRQHDSNGNRWHTNTHDGIGFVVVSASTTTNHSVVLLATTHHRRNPFFRCLLSRQLPYSFPVKRPFLVFSFFNKRSFPTPFFAVFGGRINYGSFKANHNLHFYL